MVLAVGCEEEPKKPGPTPTPAAAPTFANTSCPIMAKNAIDPAKVTEKLTRTHKGKKVAFCCGDCPAKWDKLTDAEKDTKLAAVAAKGG